MLSIHIHDVNISLSLFYSNSLFDIYMYLHQNEQPLDVIILVIDLILCISVGTCIRFPLYV